MQTSRSRKMRDIPPVFGRIGGSLAFADLASGVAFAYLSNRPGRCFWSECTDALPGPLYCSLGASLQAR